MLVTISTEQASRYVRRLPSTASAQMLAMRHIGQSLAGEMAILRGDTLKNLTSSEVKESKEVDFLGCTTVPENASAS